MAAALARNSSDDGLIWELIRVIGPCAWDFPDGARSGGTRLDGSTGLFPCREPADHMRHGLEAHVLGHLGRERRAQSAAAEEHELAVLGEDRLVVGALRVDPELEHAARA